MILLQTLSRLHVCATLAIAQMLGSVVVIIARATAPNRVSRLEDLLSPLFLTRFYLQNGPAGVFPDAALWNIGSGGDGSLNPLGVSHFTCLPSCSKLTRHCSSQHWDFWVALVCQIIIIVGYFIFFRKEQLVRLLSAI